MRTENLARIVAENEARARAAGYREHPGEYGVCRTFDDPMLEKLSCWTEDGIAYHVDGLKWAIAQLTDLLDQERDHAGSMAIGYGRALEYAIEKLNEQLDARRKQDPAAR